MPINKLNQNEIASAIAKLDSWDLEPSQPYISKEFRFNDFSSLVKFLNQVLELADRHDHHPEIVTVYTYLIIRLWTHDAGGLTQKDFRLASEIDQINS